MSRKNTAKALVLAGALTGSVVGLGGPAHAVDPVITSAGPAKVSTTADATITIKGTDFTPNAKSVVFYPKTASATYTCQGTPIVVSSTLMYVTKPASGCADGVQKVELHNVASPSADTSRIGQAFNPTLVSSTTTFATPTTVSGISPTTGSSFGGTTVTVTLASTTSSSPITATLGGRPLSSIKVLSATTFSGVTPAGTAPGAADLVVTTNGVPTAAFAGFSYKQALKVTPAAAPVANPAEIVLTGVGLKPSSPATVDVTVCGASATKITNNTLKAYTDTKLYVTAPTAAAINSARSISDFQTTGGACDVKVSVDLDGSGSTHAPVSSVLTAGSTFTYAAY